MGNAAASQRQHDVYGHVLAAAAHCFFHMDMDMATPQEVLARLADLAAQRWNQPDDSIWEMRGARALHTYSQLMCWLALDRAIALAEHGALRGDLRRWGAQRSAIESSVLSRSWNAALQAFTRTLDGEDLDAAALVAPLTGFLPADDARCRHTRRAVAERLASDGLLRRYSREDGLDGIEGAFLICSLWLADDHTLDGEPEVADAILDRVIATGNDLGLLAEEADPVTREPLGNFPLAMSHLAVIRSAIRLERARWRAGRRRVSGYGRVRRTIDLPTPRGYL